MEIISRVCAFVFNHNLLQLWSGKWDTKMVWKIKKKIKTSTSIILPLHTDESDQRAEYLSHPEILFRKSNPSPKTSRFIANFDLEEFWETFKSSTLLDPERYEVDLLKSSQWWTAIEICHFQFSETEDCIFQQLNNVD